VRTRIPISIASALGRMCCFLGARAHDIDRYPVLLLRKTAVPDHPAVAQNQLLDRKAHGRGRLLYVVANRSNADSGEELALLWCSARQDGAEGGGYPE
jgi:hypothetical protein